MCFSAVIKVLVFLSSDQAELEGGKKMQNIELRYQMSHIFIGITASVALEASECSA